MPLFFIISGYLFKEINVSQVLIKGGKRLLLPYFSTALFLCVFGFLLSNYNFQILADRFFAIFVGSGNRNNPTFLANYFVGAIWFLPALFCTQLIYNLMCRITSNLSVNKKDQVLLFLSLTISVLAVIISKSIFIPFDFLQGLGALLFYSIGTIIRKYNLFTKELNHWCLLLILVLCVCAIRIGILEMVRNYYPCYFINILAATGFTFILYRLINYTLSINLKCLKLMLKYFKHLGNLSLLILCVHIIELEFNDSFLFLNNFNLFGTKFIILIYRLFLTLVIVELVKYVGFVKSIFNLK